MVSIYELWYSKCGIYIYILLSFSASLGVLKLRYIGEVAMRLVGSTNVSGNVGSRELDRVQGRSLTIYPGLKPIYIAILSQLFGIN